MYLSAKDENISKLRSYQNILNNLIDKMTEDLGQDLKYKELSKRFWDAMPSDIRNKYMEPVMSMREKVRLIFEQYPEFRKEWETSPKNINYYRSKKREEEKRIKEQRDRMLQSVPAVEQPLEQAVTVGASMKKKKKPSAVKDYKKYWNQLKENPKPKGAKASVPNPFRQNEDYGVMPWLERVEERTKKLSMIIKQDRLWSN